MKYAVEYTARAMKQLKKLDRHVQGFLLGWIEKNLVDCEDPRRHGKSLAADRSGQWRYRIGDYRVIAEISDQTIMILVLNMGG